MSCVTSALSSMRSRRACTNVKPCWHRLTAKVLDCRDPAGRLREVDEDPATMASQPSAMARWILPAGRSERHVLLALTEGPEGEIELVQSLVVGEVRPLGLQAYVASVLGLALGLERRFEEVETGQVLRRSLFGYGLEAVEPPEVDSGTKVQQESTLMRSLRNRCNECKRRCGKDRSPLDMSGGMIPVAKGEIFLGWARLASAETSCSGGCRGRARSTRCSR